MNSAACTLDRPPWVGHETAALNFRRDGRQSDLNAQYKGLCNSDATGAGLLYGDDLPTSIKAIGETNRLSSKLAMPAGAFVLHPAWELRIQAAAVRDAWYSDMGRAISQFVSRAGRSTQLSREIVHPKGAARKDVVGSRGLQEEGHVVEPVATSEVNAEHVVTHVHELISPQSLSGRASNFLFQTD